MDPFPPKSHWFVKYWHSPKLSKKAWPTTGFAGRCLTAVKRSAWEVWSPERGGIRDILSASQLSRAMIRWRPDTFVVALAATVTLATLLPCRGTGATIFGTLGMVAIGSLFFLQ